MDELLEKLECKFNIENQCALVHVCMHEINTSGFIHTYYIYLVMDSYGFIKIRERSQF